jgi:hypothetical protein
MQDSQVAGKLLELETIARKFFSQLCMFRGVIKVGRS